MAHACSVLVRELVDGTALRACGIGTATSVPGLNVARTSKRGPVAPADHLSRNACPELPAKSPAVPATSGPGAKRPPGSSILASLCELVTSTDDSTKATIWSPSPTTTGAVAKSKLLGSRASTSTSPLVEPTGGKADGMLIEVTFG